MKSITTIRSLKHQAGLSMIGWLIIALIVSFFALCAIKLIPIYTDNLYVQQGLSSLVELEDPEDGFSDMSSAEIKRHLGSFFMLNNVKNDAQKNLEIDKSRDKTLVNMNYEVRAPLLYNISVVVTFENQFDSSRPHDCCKPLEK